MKFLSKAPLKSIAAAAAALMFLAIPAQADEKYTKCAITCLQAASAARDAAQASAAAAVQSACSQQATSQADFFACMSNGQQSITNAGQVAYSSAYNMCMGSCMASR